MIKYIKYIITIVIIAILAFIGWHVFRHANHPEEIEVSPAKAGEAEEMARLCSIEIYNEVPVLDTVNSKVIFAVQKQSGSISFDIDNLEIDDSGDTIRVVLPREIIEIYEATEKDSWQVIDTKAIGPMSILRTDKLSLAEENRVKQKVKIKAIARLYQNGTVRKARKDGAENLRQLLESVYRKPVIVTDPTPNGSQENM
ncbi:MAG: hypothetical protein K2G13_05935 [Muribaculaceae bacterium]|nr:hypothetical protein [Muribaculaceae bacterium]